MGAGILLLLILVILGIWLSNKIDGFAGAMGCTDQIIQRIDSLDGALSVFKFSRKCGATAPDSLQWNIQPFGSNFDNKKYPAFLVLESQAKATLAWRNQRSLIVKLGAVSKNYRSETESGGVVILYER